MRSLIKKEILVLLTSPIIAIVSALFLFLIGIAFTTNLTQAAPGQLPEASLRGILYFMAVVMLFISPFLTMRSLAEERRQGTLEILKTSPLSDREIVLAKYLALLFFLTLLLVLTIEFPLFLIWAGEPDPAAMILSYLGIFLLAASFLSVGLFASALTQNQMIAALLSFVFLLTLWFLPDLLGTVGERISTIEHLHSFSQGVLNLPDLAYYLFFTAFFLFLTVRVMESERWR